MKKNKPKTLLIPITYRNLILAVLVVVSLTLVFRIISKDELQLRTSPETSRSELQRENPSPTITTVPTENPKYVTIYLSSINTTKECLPVGADAVKTADANYKNSEIEYQNCLERRDRDYENCSSDCRKLVPSFLTTETAAGYAKIAIKCMEDCGNLSSEAGSICRQKQSNSLDGLSSVIQKFCR